MDKRTLQVVASLMVILPAAWGAVSKVISVYDYAKSYVERIERLERWRCANQVSPPDWSRSPGPDGKCPPKPVVTIRALPAEEQ